MTPTAFARLDDLAAHAGQLLGTSGWIRIDQVRIDRFAEATEDLQWIHVDPQRAAAGPYGAPIAHGFLTLSLLSQMAAGAFSIGDARQGLNYGLNRVRFPAPVTVGSRVRAHYRLLRFEAVPGGAQLTLEVTVEREGGTKPVCVAEWITRQFT